MMNIVIVMHIYLTIIENKSFLKINHKLKTIYFSFIAYYLFIRLVQNK
jgi:hypothetical protein